MRTYSVLVQNNESPDWSAVPSLAIDHFPWYEKGLKQDTQAQLVLGTNHLHIRFLARDIHSSAEERPLNGPVYLDSCVEFFVSPRPELNTSYLNFEVNCLGVLHLAYGPGRENRILCTPEQAKRIQIQTSLQGTSKSPSSEDQQWTVELAIPLDLIVEITGEPLQTQIWHANFYRCGGSIEDQYAVWNPISSSQPDYHRPEQFGQLIFG
jgi:hypothetical protein